MKLDGRRVAQWLRELPRLHVVCLYGSNSDMLNDCARQLILAEAGTLDDPFRISHVDADDKEHLAAALDSPSLSGGRSVVVVRHATERLLPTVEQVLRHSGVLLILEYGAATAKSRLRSVVERHAAGCIVGCYPQPDMRCMAVREVLAEFAVRAGNDVIESLAAQAEAQGTSGRAVGLAAALYAGKDGSLDLVEVEALDAAASCGGVDLGLHAGLQGNSEELDTVLTALLSDGTSPVSVLRLTLLQVQRLRAMALMVTEGRSVADAGRAVRPPVFVRQEREIAAVLARWPVEALDMAAKAVWNAERLSKSTGIPQETVCRDVLGRFAVANLRESAQP